MNPQYFCFKQMYNGFWKKCETPQGYSAQAGVCSYSTQKTAVHISGNKGVAL